MEARGSFPLDSPSLSPSSTGAGSRVPSGILAVSLGFAACAAALGFSRNPVLLAWIFGFCALAGHILARRVISFRIVLSGLCLAGLVKRTLFFFPPVAKNEYFLAILLPDLLLGISVLNVLRATSAHPCERLTRVDKLVFLFFAYLALQVFNPRVDGVVALAGFKLTALSVLGYVFGRYVGLQRQEKREEIGRVILIIAVISAIYGGWQRHADVPAFEMEWMKSGLTGLTPEHRNAGEGYRVFATFESHEQFGFFLALALLTLFVAGLGRRPSALLGLVLLLALFFTFSRSAWLALVVGLAAIACLRFKPRRAGILGMALPTAVLVAGGLFASWIVSVPDGNHWGIFSRALTTGTFSSRAAGWEQFWTDGRYWTLFGNGIGSLWAAASKFGSHVPVPHNGVLQFLYELGLAGVFMFGAFWIMMMAGFSRVREGLWRNRMAQVSFAFTVGVMVSNAGVAELFHLRQIALPFWMCAGALASVLSSGGAPSHRALA